MKNQSKDKDSPGKTNPPNKDINTQLFDEIKSILPKVSRQQEEFRLGRGNVF